MVWGLNARGTGRYRTVAGVGAVGVVLRHTTIKDRQRPTETGRERWTRREIDNGRQRQGETDRGIRIHGDTDRYVETQTETAMCRKRCTKTHRARQAQADAGRDWNRKRETH